MGDIAKKEYGAHNKAEGENEMQTWTLNERFRARYNNEQVGGVAKLY